jgi:hypothetical protein
MNCLYAFYLFSVFVSNYLFDYLTMCVSMYRGVKSTLLYARDHSIKDSLEQVKMHNAAMLHSNDLKSAMMAYSTKSKPTFHGH